LPAWTIAKDWTRANESGWLPSFEHKRSTNEIKVVGFDNIAVVQTLIRAGEVLATADQHADALPVYGINYALELLRGGQTPADRETPIDLINAAAPGV
jgi:ribose transport system substrate-binding protein